VTFCKVMESTDGSALHGYGLRSHGPVTTEPIPSDAMVGSGLTEAISSAEHSALGARMVAVHGQDAQAPLLSSPALPGTDNGGAQSPLARLGVGTLPSAHLRGAANRSKPRSSPRPMDESLLLKTPALPGSTSDCSTRLTPPTQQARIRRRRMQHPTCTTRTPPRHKNVYDEDATSSPPSSNSSSATLSHRPDAAQHEHEHECWTRPSRPHLAC
jgi:hypothetical protein